MHKLKRNSFLQLVTYETKYSRMDQLKFLEDSLWKSRPYPFKFLKAVFHRFYYVHSWILCHIFESRMSLSQKIVLMNRSCRRYTVRFCWRISQSIIQELPVEGIRHPLGSSNRAKFYLYCPTLWPIMVSERLKNAFKMDC